MLRRTLTVASLLSHLGSLPAVAQPPPPPAAAPLLAPRTRLDNVAAAGYTASILSLVTGPILFAVGVGEGIGQLWDSDPSDTPAVLAVVGATFWGMGTLGLLTSIVLDLHSAGGAPLSLELGPAPGGGGALALAGRF